MVWEAPFTKRHFAMRALARLSFRKVMIAFGLFGIFFAGASAVYALVITNQTNTNVVLSYGIW